jgi:hypothetical protein
MKVFEDEEEVEILPDSAGIIVKDNGIGLVLVMRSRYSEYFND